MAHETSCTNVPLTHTLQYLRRFRRHPWDTLQAIRDDHGDLARLRLPRPIVCLFHPQLIEALLLSQAAHLQKGRQTQLLRQVADGLLTSEGRVWREKRRLFAPLFTQRSVLRHCELTYRTAATEVEAWPRRQTFDLSQKIAELMLVLATRFLFGEHASLSAVRTLKADIEFMGDTLFRQVSALWPKPLWLPTARHRRFRAAKRRLDGILDDLLLTQRRTGAPSFVGQLLESHKDMPQRDLREEVATLLLAGFETTTAWLVWTFYLLGQNPDAHTALVAACAAEGDPNTCPALLDATLDEALRLFPPSPLITRENSAPVTLAETGFPPGTNFIMPQYIVQRDPRFWTEPRRFSPQRFADQAAPRGGFFPFSLGPRHCVGAQLARLEAQAVVRTILAHGPITPARAQKEPVFAPVLRPHTPLFATLT